VPKKRKKTDHQGVHLKDIHSKDSLHEELSEDHQQNILGIYEKQIREIPLLTVEEEIKVGRILQEGTEEEKQAAKCKLVRSNLRFVLMMAKKNQHRNDLDLLDAIRAGKYGAHGSCREIRSYVQ
jgi:DNA-directed RNA polymerase sigma subunit (sigma70/sigma32)